MWSSLVLVGLSSGLLTGFDPMRLGLALLVISRPRPVQNLLAYGVGNLIACVFTVVFPLTMLHNTPMLKSFADNLATSPTVKHIQLAMGVVALSIGALLLVHSLARWRQRAHSTAASGPASTQVLESQKPSAISRLLGRPQDVPPEGASGFRGLLNRAHNAWENGSLWVAGALGLGTGPPLDGVLFLLAFIVASGAATGTQAVAAVAFVIGMLAVIEFTLASYLAAPAKTQAIVQRLHDWARTHRRKILIAMCAVGGLALIGTGMGGAAGS
ncbi:GAP family protein [Mycobacterium celatum]|uniref:GAP family protein n=1 Tax=Mycobacterium celatum TaxID=28045 RepID=A0A1X1RU55_MYCCE|nr:GAP family protein [Mycobacterium celatum]ORV16696.1 gap protein [Mycobacterium celatum]PIB79311.1 GAP family protein [Mycobacterium celatum]